MDRISCNVAYVSLSWPDGGTSRTLSPVHTSDNVAKNRDIVAKNGNNIEATLSKQLLVFNPVAMPPQKYKSMGLGTEVSSGVQGQNPCKGLGTVSQKLNHFDMCIALSCP